MEKLRLTKEDNIGEEKIETSASQELKQEKYLVDEISEQERISRLREFHLERLKSHPFRSMFRWVKEKRNRYIWDRFIYRLNERETFLRSSIPTLEEVSADIFSDTDESKPATIPTGWTIQHMKPLWSAFATEDEVSTTGNMLEMTIDNAVEVESDNILDQIREGRNYVSVLVVGAGVHGAIFNSTFRSEYPNKSILTIDSYTTIGGQFRQYGRPVIKMNTPNTPLNMKKDANPSIDNTNRFGDVAPVQLTDIDPNHYADNNKVGMAAAINQFFSSPTLIGTQVLTVKKNINKQNGAKFEVIAIHKKTGEIITIYTDKIAFATGIGEVDFDPRNFDEECRSESMRIINSERSKTREHPGTAKVITYTDLLKEFGDPNNPLPMQRFINKRILIVGGGDSGMTSAELLTGLGPRDAYDAGVASLGSPAEIVIVGTKHITDPERENQKYATGFDFKKEGFSRYVQSEQFIENRHADDRLSNNTQSETKEKRERMITLVDRYKVVGLEEQTDGRIRARIVKKVTNPDGSTTVLDEDSYDADIVIFTTGYKKKTSDILKSFCEDEGDLITEDSEDEKGKSFAETISGEKDIILLGPARNTDRLPSKDPVHDALNQPQNVISIARNTEATQRCAQYISRELLKRDLEKGSGSRHDEIKQFNPDKTSISLSDFENGSQMKRKFAFYIKDLRGLIPKGISYSDIIDYSFYAELDRFKFPTEIETLRLRIERKKDKDAVVFIFKFEDNVPKQFIGILENLSKTPYFFKSLDREMDEDFINYKINLKRKRNEGVVVQE
jgi:hypothetical protein